ncbi:coenzyme F420-reducing hydrogenase alpha subunit [Thermovibrio guaymasensis]|uniref:Coenzyme F420-reducing hydrogenase alpha subunit n=1 Tax=Thermovibrio guaymasensis TaxID=240167 RepID=A0A420W8F8_9BACT|nr:Ni/Fe hydrogenase subunit alpha [Thermovibrio guaymasensis]RKQ63562.1 coenzyme F420-reducing hydrogenase alpha subunit [Thermovibrio guaymasensis]
MKKELNVNHLTRVEGHGAVDIVIENSRLSEIRLRFAEGPRFFEVITKDRLYTEIPKIVSRICGICYVSHRLAAVFAIEDAFRVKVNRGIELLRSLLTVGEFLESHSLHIYFLALPDYMGYPSTLAMVKDYPNVVKRGFKLKEVGNRIMKLIGGKTVHGENILVGGFASIPSREELEEVGRSLLKLIPEIESTLFFLDGLEYPEFESSHEMEMCLNSPSPSLFSSEVSLSDGTNFTKREYELFVREEVSPYSTAKVSKVKGKPFLIGPLARVNRLELHPKVLELTKRLKHSFPSKNSHLANLARAVELLDVAYRGVEFVEELLSLYPFEPTVEVNPREGTGFGVKEAPRGTLYHKYTFDSKGRCIGANIITPTAQLQSVIEDDLRALVETSLDSEDSEIKKRAEVLIRAYDP